MGRWGDGASVGRWGRARLVRHVQCSVLCTVHCALHCSTVQYVQSAACSAVQDRTLSLSWLLCLLLFGGTVLVIKPTGLYPTGQAAVLEQVMMMVMMVESGWCMVDGVWWMVDDVSC